MGRNRYMNQIKRELDDFNKIQEEKEDIRRINKDYEDNKEYLDEVNKEVSKIFSGLKVTRKDKK